MRPISCVLCVTPPPAGDNAEHRVPIGIKLMSPMPKVAVVIALILIGPIMFFGSRELSLKRAFSKIAVGDTTAVVTATMGKPESEIRAGLKSNVDIEYRYSAWPLPIVWAIDFQNDKVVVKTEK
jgi:hypothetical protein